MTWQADLVAGRVCLLLLIAFAVLVSSKHQRYGCAASLLLGRRSLAAELGAALQSQRTGLSLQWLLISLQSTGSRARAQKL